MQRKRVREIEEESKRERERDGSEWEVIGRQADR